MPLLLLLEKLFFENLRIYIYSFTPYAGIIHKGNKRNWSDEAYTLQFYRKRRILLAIFGERRTREMPTSHATDRAGTFYMRFISRNSYRGQSTHDGNRHHQLKQGKAIRMIISKNFRPVQVELSRQLKFKFFFP